MCDSVANVSIHSVHIAQWMCWKKNQLNQVDNVECSVFGPILANASWLNMHIMHFVRFHDCNDKYKSGVRSAHMNYFECNACLKRRHAKKQLSIASKLWNILKIHMHV